MDGLMDELYDPVESSALEPDDDKQMVSRAVLRQAMWERDIALKQLSEIGKGLGEKMDDVAPVVHGKFVQDGPRFRGGVDWWHCSNCGKLVSGVEARYKFCPECGAKMDKEMR